MIETGDLPYIALSWKHVRDRNSSAELVPLDSSRIRNRKDGVRWTFQETNLFLKYVRQYGKMWRLIANKIKTKSP